MMIHGWGEGGGGLGRGQVEGMHFLKTNLN